MSASAGNAGSAAAAQPIASVVVPAYNEEAVIDRTLAGLTRGSDTGEFDIVVVANGCRDRTVDIAERHGVRVLSTPVGGKAKALRLGDAACRTYPRIYLDADVTLSAESVRELVAALGKPGILAAAPVPEWNLDGAGRVARRICKVHDALMSRSRALAGVGVYALTEEAHDRVFPIPDVICDDEWVHRSFGSSERQTVPAARSVVRPARTVRAHLARRVRVRQGNRQLDEMGKPAPRGTLRLRTLSTLVINRVVGPVDAACYLGVLAADRVVSRWAGSGGPSWSTDATTRA